MPIGIASDKVPYVVTLLAAALAWTVQRAATVLTEAPTIAYSVKCDGEDVIASIENLSRTRQFRDLKFHLQTQNDDVFMGKDGNCRPMCSITPLAPAMQPTGSFLPELSKKGGDISYPIPLLEPGWKFELRAKRKATVPVVLTVEFDTALPTTDIPAKTQGIAHSDEALRMVKAGFSTWIVKNEIGVLFGLTGVWFFLMILCLIFL